MYVMKISSLSQSDLLNQVDVSVKAALSIPTLQQTLQDHGLSSEKVKVGLNLVKAVIDSQDRQTATANNARRTQQTFRIAKETIAGLYFRHLEIARFLYREDIDQQETLQLRGARHTRYAGWFEQVRVFYKHLDPQVLESFRVPAKEISEVKKLLTQLTELQVLRNDAKRQAQQVTHQKQLAVNDLRHWFRRFTNAAKFACQDDPQLLESMGIVVPDNS